MKPIWTLVANRSRALIFSSTSRTKAPVIIDVIEHPEGRLTSGQINTDKQGQSFESASNSRHSMQPQQSPEEHKAMIFAHKLASALEASNGQFEKLVVVAPAPFLGVLRASFHGRLKARTMQSVVKDIAGQTDHEITVVVQELIANLDAGSRIQP